MKKHLLLIAVFAASMNLFAQLPAGSFAPDFTMTDLEGREHHLYAYLDSGYTVVIDFSAVWCGPCWNYHNSGSLEELYINHGPAGYPNVSANTTDDVMVFFIEGDEGTVDQLNGIGGGTQGNWVEGTPYPIIPTVAPNNNNVTSDYQIGYWPTIYMICPDRNVTENGQISTSEHYSAAQGCPAPGILTNDAKLKDILKPTGINCSTSITPSVSIQNYGTETLQSLDIISFIDNVAVDTFAWSGSLDQYFIDEVNLNEIGNLEDGNFTYSAQIVNPNHFDDEDITNDSLNSQFGVLSDGEEVLLGVQTDGYPNETSWEILMGGEVILSNDNFVYSNYYSQDVLCLYPDSCYTFVLHDSYGDGMPGGYVDITWNGMNLLHITGSSFNSVVSEEFCIQEPPSTENNILTYSIDGEAQPCHFNMTFHKIKVYMPDTVDMSALVATFSISDLATIDVDGVEQISGVTVNDFSAPVSYNVVAESGDTAVWEVTIDSVATSVKDLAVEKLKVYPNPSTGMVYIENNKPGAVYIYNMVGKNVFNESVSPKGNVNISELPDGLYIMKFVSGDKTYSTKFNLIK